MFELDVKKLKALKTVATIIGAAGTMVGLACEVFVEPQLADAKLTEKIAEAVAKQISK